MSARQVLSAVRGEPRRLGKLRHLLALLRPYRGRVVLMLIALLLATAAALVPPAPWPASRSTPASRTGT